MFAHVCVCVCMCVCVCINVCVFLYIYGLMDVVVMASASRATDPWFDSHLRQDFSGSSCTSDLKMCTSVATLPGAWHHRISAGTGLPGVSIL